MPKINTYEQQTTVNLRGNIAAAPEISIPNSIGQGFASLQQGTSSLQQAASENEYYSAREQSRRTNEAQAIQASTLSSQAQIDWTQKFNDAQRNATGTANDFTKNFMDEYNQYKNKVLENYTPGSPAYNYTNHELSQLGQSFQNKGLSFENEAFNNDKINNLTKTVENNSNLLLQDPSQYINIKAKTNAIIQNSGLDADKQYKFKELADKSFTNASWNNLILNNPTRAVSMLQPTVGQEVTNTSAGVIINQAKTSGIDPVYALTVGQIESGNNPNAKSNESSAFGTYQFTKATAKQYGINPNSTPEEQFNAFAKLTKDNKATLTAQLGQQPTNEQLRLAHMFGAGGAAKLIQADPNASVEDIVGKKVIDQNPQLAGKTVGQVIQNNDTQYNNTAARFADKTYTAAQTNPMVADLTPEQRVRFLKQAQDAVETRNQAVVLDLQNTIKNHEAMANNGDTSFTPLTQNDFSAMYPSNPDKATIAYNQYDRMVQVGKAVSLVNTQSAAEDNAMLQRLSPKNADTYAIDAKTQSIYAEALAKKYNAIKQDPAQWAMSNNHIVKDAFSKIGGITNPQQKQIALNDAYKLMISEQTKQGVINPTLLTKNDADNINQQFANAKGMDKVAILQQLQSQYGNYFGMVNNQLQSIEHAPEGMTAIISAPSAAAQQRAALLSEVKIDQLKSALPSDIKASDVDVKVNSYLNSFNSSFPAYALAGSNITDVKNNITKAAYENAIQTGSSDKAAKSAVQQFINDKYNFIDNKDSEYKVRIPVKYSSDIIENKLDAKRKSLTENDLDLGNVELQTNPWFGTKTASGYIDNIKSHGFWLTNGKEDGAKLYFVGNNNIPYPVLDKNKQQIEVSF